MLIPLNQLTKHFNTNITGVLHVGAHECEELQAYLNEEYDVDHVLNVLKRDCKKYIDFIKKYKPTYFVYRGVKKSNDDYTTKITRTNRKPLDTPPDIHNILDELFFEKFGWNISWTGRLDILFTGHFHF